MADSQQICGACRDDVKLPAFIMAYQPIVDVRRREIYGYEALVRGPAGEAAFSILNQITAESRYAFDQACRVKAIDQAACLGLRQRLSINFMPNAVYSPAACIRATLIAAEKARFPLDLITFEITEDERIHDTGHLQGIITEYRGHGFRVALDDFGAGYASLGSLDALDVDVIKLDMTLIRDIDRNPRRRQIALGMIAVCRELGINVVAEGVEREGELEILMDAGVDYVQGYYFAKPALNHLATIEEIIRAL